jgi:hypothetical protein
VRTVPTLATRLDRALPAALALVVALPALLTAATMARSGWRPVGLDMALELLRTWEVGSRHTPLVGAYSRYGWDHPGPLLFAVSAPAVRLMGPTGLLVTAGVVNAAAAAGTVLAAHRIAGLRLALPAAVAAALMTHALTAAGITDPWNPYVAVLPFLAYLVCVWGAVNGDRVLLVAAVVAGSWCVQAHLGYLPITLAAAGLGGGLRLAWRRSRAPAALPRPWVAAALAVGVLLWLPPLIDQVTDAHGNLGDLVAFARDGTNPAELEARPVGWSAALDAMSGMVTPPAPWTTPVGPNQYLEVPDGTATAATVVVVGLVAVGGLAWWRGRRRPAVLVGLSVVLVGLSVVAMARASDDLYGYLIRWSWGVAALAWTAGAWAVVELVGRREPGRRPAAPVLPVLAAAAVLAIAVLGVRTVTDGSTHRVTHDPAVTAVTDVSRQLRTELDPDVTYELVADSNWHYLVAPGIAVDLITHGQRLVVSPGLAPTFKTWRTADPDRQYPQVVLLPTVGVPVWRLQHPDARRLATHVPRTRAERAEPVTGVPHEAWLVPTRRRGGGRA